jgi:hypothetical protein
MKILNDYECLQWLGSCGLETSQYSDMLDLVSQLPLPNSGGLRYALPDESGKKVALARSLFWQAQLGSSVMVWLGNWMVWPSCAHIPMLLRLRQGMGCALSLEDASGHLFEPTEIDDAVSLLIVCLIFYWDCLVFDTNRKLVCYVSHDKNMILMSADEFFLNHLGDVIETAKLCKRLP